MSSLSGTLSLSLSLELSLSPWNSLELSLRLGTYLGFGLHQLQEVARVGELEREEDMGIALEHVLQRDHVRVCVDQLEHATFHVCVVARPGDALKRDFSSGRAMQSQVHFAHRSLAHQQLLLVVHCGAHHQVAVLLSLEMFFLVVFSGDVYALRAVLSTLSLSLLRIVCVCVCMYRLGGVRSMTKAQNDQVRLQTPAFERTQRWRTPAGGRSVWN
jgi:hypothetical protein